MALSLVNITQTNCDNPSPFCFKCTSLHKFAFHCIYFRCVVLFCIKEHCRHTSALLSLYCDHLTATAFSIYLNHQQLVLLFQFTNFRCSDHVIMMDPTPPTPATILPETVTLTENDQTTRLSAQDFWLSANVHCRYTLAF